MIASPPHPDPATTCKIVAPTFNGYVMALYPAGGSQKIVPIRLAGRYWKIKWC